MGHCHVGICLSKHPTFFQVSCCDHLNFDFFQLQPTFNFNQFCFCLGHPSLHFSCALGFYRCFFSSFVVICFCAIAFILLFLWLSVFLFLCNINFPLLFFQRGLKVIINLDCLHTHFRDMFRSVTCLLLINHLLLPGQSTRKITVKINFSRSVILLLWQLCRKVCASDENLSRLGSLQFEPRVDRVWRLKEVFGGENNKAKEFVFSKSLLVEHFNLHLSWFLR